MSVIDTARFILALGIACVGTALACLSMYNLHSLSGWWRRAMRIAVAVAAAGISMFYFLGIFNNQLNIDPIQPEFYRAMLLIMLAAGLAVEISNTPPRKL